jgi:ribose/xylose/arabinose/galactoside ABC-type transport system permease subunit
MPNAKNSLIRKVLYSVEVKLLFAWLAVVGVTMILDPGGTYYNSPGPSAVMILRNTVLLGFFALGAAVIIVSGGIDLSSGSVIAMSATVFGAILVTVDPEGFQSGHIAKWAVVVAFAGTLLAAFFVGTIHAWLITCIGLPPFVATLASLVGLRSFARGLTLVVTNNKSQIDFPDLTLRDVLKDVTYISIAFIVFAALIWFLMSCTVFGRHLHAMGGNEQAAKLSGIRTDRLKWAAYVIGSVSASLVGIVYFADSGSAKPDILARGYELNAIAASVIGGCSLQGGIGTIPGAVLGCLFLRTVIDAVNKIVGTGSDVYEGMIVGIVVVMAVTFSQRSNTAIKKVYFSSPIGWFTLPALSLLAGLSFMMFFKDREWFNSLHPVVFGGIVALLLGVRGWLEASRHRKAGS